MEMTRERLCRFDLVEECEKILPATENMHALLDYFQTMQQIQSVDQFIKEAPSFPDSTTRIVRSEMISAIGATLSIEGTILAGEEIEASFKKASLNESLTRKEQEAENSRQVYSFIIELVRNHKGKFGYTEQMIRQVHKLFTDNMNYLSNTPGQYRGEYVPTFGVPRKSSLCRSSIEVAEAMKGLVEWINRQGAGPLSTNMIVKAIMAHYYLTEIHPFADGNGRTARALEALVLFANGVNSYCFWSLANFWSTHRDQYLIHLDNVRSTCNPLDFLIWGMKGYLEEITKVKNRVLTKVKQLMLMDYTKYLVDSGESRQDEKAKVLRLGKRTIDVVRLLVRSGPVPLDKFSLSPEIRALYKNVSASTKSRDFAKMGAFGLIHIAKRDDKLFIEPNYRILATLQYSI